MYRIQHLSSLFGCFVHPNLLNTAFLQCYSSVLCYSSHRLKKKAATQNSLPAPSRFRVDSLHFLTRIHSEAGHEPPHADSLGPKCDCCVLTCTEEENTLGFCSKHTNPQVCERIAPQCAGSVPPSASTCCANALR